MIQFTNRPGRYVRYCASDVEDLCAYISQDDFIQSAWGLDGDALASVQLNFNPLGLITSIDSHPNGFLYDSGSVIRATMIWNGTVYAPNSEVDISAGGFYVQIPGISVTLTDGSICSATFLQYFNTQPAVIEVAEWTGITTKQTAFTINLTAGPGRIDWGDGSSTSFSTVSTTNFSKTYGSPGTYTVECYTDAFDSSQFEATNENLISLNFQNSPNMSDIDVRTNSALAAITLPSSSTVVWVKFLASSCALTSLNMSTCTKLGGRFEVHLNSGLTSILFPVSTQAFTTLLAYSCNLTGTISIANLLGLAGQVQFNSNPLLTAILWPASTGTLTRLHLSSTGWIGACNLTTVTVTTDFEMRSCIALTSLTFKSSDVPTGGWTMNNFLTYSSTNLTGTLDVSMFNVGGTFQIYSCDIDALITNSSNTGALTSCRIDGNNFTGSVDLSDWDIRGSFYCSNNSGLTDIVHSANGGSITQYFCNSCNATYYDITMLGFTSSATIEFQNNSMTAAEINHLLVDLDSILGAGTGTIRLAGTNAAPDGSSGGYDGTTAKANLIIKGWSVTTS